MAGMLDGEEMSFRVVGDDDAAVFTVSRTTPHAICLAVLQAVGSTQDKQCEGANHLLVPSFETI